MPLRPTGIVTLLFTDIEGSTRLWEKHPDAMRGALARHDELLRACIEAHGGHVFKTIGDAFCAAFATAGQALDAALAAQRALAGERWGMPESLTVRMGLHTGACEERGGDYFGPPLNRVARLMAAGHGGQTLLSGVTQDLVRGALPPGAALQDLGARRLRDLGRPETVFQLLHPDLPTDFPPLRSLDNPDLPNNLPQQVTSFIGRGTQVAEVRALLGRTRLLTLTGSGGSGKTRLALQAAADLLDRYFDGVWLVELASLSDPALVPQAVAGVLGVKEQAGQPLPGTLVEWLKPRRLLLVLDNCEHLIAACASLAADLLRSCPDVQVLATSREALNVPGEQTYRVPSLSLPDPTQAQTVESLSRYEAVTLFIERARAARPDFAVSSASAPAVAQVCARLDGIPLAIELAAARLRSLSVDEVNARLDQRFRLLAGGARTALPRQQTLRALIDWSYDLLTDAEKTLLRRLSVFAGGWTLEAAEAVCAGDGVEDWEVLDRLTALVDKSLAVAEPAGDTTRYRLLDTVRQYAGDRLDESGEADAVRGRAGAWFLAFAEEAEPRLAGPEQASWLARLEAEHDNLRASLAWEEGSSAGGAAGLRLAGALNRFWQVRGHFSEGRQWLDRALARVDAGADDRESLAARAKALNGAGILVSGQGDHAAARALYEEGLAIMRRLGDERGIATSFGNLGNVAYCQGDYAAARTLHEEGLVRRRRLGDRQGIARSLNNLGNVAYSQGDYPAARTLYGESLALRRQLEDQQGIANALHNVANVAVVQGDYPAAQALHEEGLTIYRRLGDQGSITHSLGNLGHLAFVRGDYPAAQALHEEGLTLARRLGYPQGVADALNNLGNVAFRRGDPAAARALYEESLALRQQLGNPQAIARSLGNLGNLAFVQGDYPAAWALYAQSLTLDRQSGDPQGTVGGLDGMADLASGQRRPARAARLGGASAALRAAIGSPLPPLDQEEVDATMTAARAALGDAAFAAAWDAGRAMTMEQAVEYALSDTD